MSNELIPIPPAGIPLPDSDALASRRDMINDPGLASLRRYLPVLAVIAAPYAGLGGDQDPLNPLDRVGEWRLLVEAAEKTAQLQSGVPLALVRLTPPTAERLAEALQAGGADSFAVVHLVCHGERDMLYLEDDSGHEAYVVAEHLIRLFKPSRARLVVMDGCFNRRLAELLVDQAGVEAVVGTRRKVAEASAITFTARFYAEIANGVGVRQAYRTAIGELEAQPDGQADRYDLLIRDDRPEYTLPLPGTHAAHPLIDGGLPHWIEPSQQTRFIGRRDELSDLAQEITERIVVVQGPVGIGKTWLVSEAVGRFGWRFPDGVLWFQGNEQTAAREVIAWLAHLLELPVTAPAETVLAALRQRRILLVLDQIDALASPAELEQVVTFVDQIDPQAGSSALLITRSLIEPLHRLGAARILTLNALTPKDARTLALRLAVERGIEALDVDTIDDFLERTLGIPWLIVRGVDWVESDGIGEALKDLSDFKPDMPDPLGLYLGRRLKLLALETDSPLVLIVRAQNLPDAFDNEVAESLGGESTPAYLAQLLKYGLLRRDGTLYAIPPTVRALLRQSYFLTVEQQDRLDRFIMQTLVRTWPTGQPLSDREQQARLNNVRSLLQRHMQAGSGFDPVLAARLLAAAAPTFRAAGLIEPFLETARLIRERLSEGADLARLQTAMGEALSLLPGRENEAGWIFQITTALRHLDAQTQAEVARSYCRFLLDVGQTPAAEALLSQALHGLLAAHTTNVLLAAGLAHDWAKALALLERYEEAVARFEAALAGYAQEQRADRSAEAQCDLSEALIRLDDLDRADDLLRRALVTADQLGLRPLAGQVRRQLAAVHQAYASRVSTAESRIEWESAEQLLCDAIADWLPHLGAGALADLHLELGRVQARLSRLDEAAASIERSRRLFERANSPTDWAAASVTLGQIRMAQGNAVAAQQVLTEALDTAAAQGDQQTLNQAAGILVRVYQIRARHARQGNRQFRQDTIEQARQVREQLAALDLGEHVAALDAAVREM